MAGQAITPDGIAITNRVDGKTLRDLNNKVIDTVLNGPTYISRQMRKARKFSGSIKDFTIKYQASSQFEWFVGIETFNASAEDNEITLSYAHTGGTQPKVSIMLESFANAGEKGVIPLDAYKFQEAGVEVTQNVASAIYGDGSANKPNGLQSIVDDSTNAATIGGQSRATYSTLNATYTDSSGVISLAKLGVGDDAAARGGELAAVPNINVTDFPTWSFYEQLIDPQMRANYNSDGFPMLGVGTEGTVSRAKLGGGAGFQALHHRGMPAIKDKQATSGVWYKLNESSFAWYGRTVVPTEYATLGLRKADLGDMSTYESVAGEEAPSSFNGWFYQPPMMMPDQAGTIARFYVIGQMMTWNPNMNMQLHSITGI